MAAAQASELRALLSPAQLAQLDAVRGQLLVDPAALDKRAAEELLSEPEGENNG